MHTSQQRSLQEQEECRVTTKLIAEVMQESGGATEQSLGSAASHLV